MLVRLMPRACSHAVSIPVGSERGDEHEGQIDAAKIREHARAGGGETLQHGALRRLNGVGHKDTDDAGNQRGEKAQLDAVLETDQKDSVGNQAHIYKGPSAGLAVERR